MKKINVIVKEKTLLELAEDANKGDLIDLEELVEVDMSYLERIIESGKDKIYESKLLEREKLIRAECTKNIQSYEQEIRHLKIIQEKEIKEKVSEKEKELTKTIDKITQEKELLKQRIESDLKQKELEYKEYFEKELNKLQNTIDTLKATKEAEIDKNKAEIESQKEKELSKQKEFYEKQLREKEDLINSLQRSKSQMNVKQIGEDLESWCDNEVNSYMQNGLLNCTWTKDNKVVKNEDDTKGSKADYIFKIYASNKHDEKELLSSICLDMKDENPDSINKKTNSHYYKQLDNNRNKKNCKYAVLVSTLETDKPNDIPIFKVREYEDMYVVRPGYLMVFLNMIASLTSRFSMLVLSKEKEILELKDKTDLIQEFNTIKETYLDKPLNALENNISSIYSSSDSIKAACRNIEEQCEKVKKNYISQITEKLAKFELKINKNIIKKM